MIVAAGAAVIGVLSGAAAGKQESLPPNDLNNLLALTGVPTPAAAPVQENPEPPLQATPPPHCGPGSHAPRRRRWTRAGLGGKFARRGARLDLQPLAL